MNVYQLSITAQWRPETLERILRVVRHRGFCVQAMNMQLVDNTVELNVTVHSDRTLHLLTNQLVKLFGIERVIETA
ncbi:acetolactate synthase 2 small subunit [Pasteurellaceae bacterium HPA106]|uniref:acetolactate synthase 2 small subunit n=1 Tax=Spirabiliibacterium pneumoniae TaxID=221400 RepID=UPI001AAD2288|nr:acetolactate synthase 2 small subunit [Spirabiliibacterium pneumoniae]MBE2897270.1 acetolactate synthase 2 small subunit [Spirabiliibacterium pneumoniae]